MEHPFLMFLDHTRRTTVGRTPLDEWSARRRDLYLTTHNTHNRQTSMLPVGFEHTISAGERPQTYALDRAATGTGDWNIYIYIYWKIRIYIICAFLELTSYRRDITCNTNDLCKNVTILLTVSSREAFWTPLSKSSLGGVGVDFDVILLIFDYHKILTLSVCIYDISARSR